MMATTAMNSNFAQPSAYTAPAFQYPQGTVKTPSPTGSSPTSPYNSHNITPPHTSPTTPSVGFPSMAPRQLQTPKCAMYRPAALRTTERATLVTNTKQDAPAAAAMVHRAPPKVPKVEIVEQIEPKVGSTEEVTGPPSKANWKPDSEATVCDAPICNKTFSLFDRRHHCRRCGNIFCANHTSQFLKLDQNCRYNAKGIDSRVCIGCFDEYKRLCAKSRSSSTSSTSTVGRPLSTPQQARDPKDPNDPNTLRGRLNSYVGSYRDNWSWSTF